MIAIVAVSIALMAMGHYRHRTLSFRDDINESNRQFHRARLEEIPDLVSSGLIHSDQLTAIESESKHDLLSDMRGSETASAAQLTAAGRHRGGLLAALLVGMTAVGLYADFGASMGRVQEVAWTEALEALDLSRAADVENAYELMKQWRDANPSDEAVQMFSAELALNLGRYREAADSLSALSNAYPMDKKLTVQSLEARYLADKRVMSAALKADFDNALSRYPNEIGLLEIAGMEAHKAGDVGIDFGPALTEIGDKLAREAMYLSIIEPNQAISFGFEGYSVKTKTGLTLIGYITSESANELVMKVPGGVTVTTNKSDIISKVPINGSLMPEGLVDSMSKQELVDLVEYLMTLKKRI